MTSTLRYSSPRDAQGSKTPDSASRSESSRRCRANRRERRPPKLPPRGPSRHRRNGGDAPRNPPAARQFVAGITMLAPIDAIDQAQIRRQLTVNVEGPISTVRVWLPYRYSDAVIAL